MKDHREEIKRIFGTYAHYFNSLQPTKVAPFFHLPAMLMTSAQVAVMQTSIEVLEIFAVLMDDLKAKNFKKSEIIGDLQVTQLSDNQGQVIGVAKRFNDKDEEIEHFGFTYILRKIQVEDRDRVTDEWKIIAGILHEPESLSK